MTLHRLLTGLLLVALVAVPIGSAVTPPVTTTPDGAVRLFVSDDHDPADGTLPPFVFTGIGDLVRADNISVANLSRMRDIAYRTTQPSYRVGEAEQTLSEYRRAQIRAIERNESTTLWLPDSQLSNGTVVTNGHITLLGTTSGVHTRLSTEETNGSDRWLIPRNGTVLTCLDYSTRVPNRTCTVTNETRTCRSYTLVNQSVNRTVQIGTQTWAANSSSPRRLTYAGATASEPTTLQVNATINTTLAVETTTYVREPSGWRLSNLTATETRSVTHTVGDRTRAVVTTNQNLTVSQTLVRSAGEVERVILRFNGSPTIADRRLWSYATFDKRSGQVRNVWGVYSQRQYLNATRSRQSGTGTNATSLSATNTTRAGQTVPFPNVLELRLVAQRRQPAVQQTGNVSVTGSPEISQTTGFNLSEGAAPLGQHVNLTSVPPRGVTTVVISNVDHPITEVRDIHNDSIPLTTQTVRERNTSLSTTVLNETHVRIQLTDAGGQPLAGRPLWLSGAAQGRVTTDGDGTAVVERRDLYVSVSFPGAANASRSAYYGPAETQVAFQPEPFNIYQMLSSFAGALLSVAAFLIFFVPFAYMRRGGGR